MQLDRYPWWFLTKCMKVCLPAGSGDRSSATPSQAAPQNRGWCGSNRPAWAWPRTWAGLCGPNRRYSAPPLRFSQTPPCLRSAVLLPWSATNPHTPFNITMLLSFFTLYFPFNFFFFFILLLLQFLVQEFPSGFIKVLLNLILHTTTWSTGWESSFIS